MPSALCELCQLRRCVIKRPKNGRRVCKECFFHCFELEVHKTITNFELFKRNERVGIGASGGKDSTVLAYIMSLLNKRYDYGLELYLISVDEGIHGYRDDSLETVKHNEIQYGIPLHIISYKELYGWTMDEIVKQTGKKNNCTYCGVFRRQALDRAASMMKVDHIVTGHNADDIAETVVMNLFRGDIARLPRSTEISTDTSEGSAIRRSKPLIFAYEKEIVLYAHFKKLEYFSTECTYSPEAFRGTARAMIKDLEKIDPRTIINIIYSGLSMKSNSETKKRLKPMRACEKCNFMSSNAICKACLLLESLNKGLSQISLT